MYQDQQKQQRDTLESKREESARQNFKKVLADLLVLLRESTGVETTILFWVNSGRQIFVQENHATVCDNIMLPDRISFSDLYLQDFLDLKEPVQLKVGRDVMEEELTHYFDHVPVSWVTLVPFVNNGETVALTVLESSMDAFEGRHTMTIDAFEDALANLLQSYLELSGLSDSQAQWVDYEEQLQQFDERMDMIPLLQTAVKELQGYLEQGNVSLLCRGMNSWNVVLNARFGVNAPSLGLPVEEQSVAWQALQEGTPQFVIHFNASPKRVSPREPESKGATLAVPVLVEGRRHAVYVISDENPLIFSEARRHKLTNLIRVVSLKLATLTQDISVSEDLLTEKHGAYSNELMETAIQQELTRPASVKSTPVKVGMITLTDVPGLRAKLRMDALDRLQQQLIEWLNPQQYGHHGYLAWHSDYVFSFILQSGAEHAVEDWYKEIREAFASPVEIDEQTLRLDFHIGAVDLDEGFEDYQAVLQAARKQLSASVKSQGTSAVN